MFPTRIQTGSRGEGVEVELVLAIGNGTGAGTVISIAAELRVLRSYCSIIDGWIRIILPDGITLVGTTGFTRVAVARSIAICLRGRFRQLCAAVAISIIDQGSVFESIGLLELFCTLGTCSLNRIKGV